jgi:ABC-type hemin transport system substrate-binding protein
MRMPSLKRDLVGAVGFILLAAGPPVWAGSLLDASQNTALGSQLQNMVTPDGSKADDLVALGIGDRLAAFDGSSHRVPVLGLRADGELAAALVSEGGVPQRVLAVFPRADGMSHVAGEGTIADKMLQVAGGVNAFGGTRGYSSPTAESVGLARPDVLLLTTYGLTVLGGETGLWSNPSLAQLDRTKVRLVVIDDHLLLGVGSRVGEAALALATQPYGEPTP